MTLLNFQLIIIITVLIQITVLNQFSWNSHGCCESTHGWILFFFYFFFFWNNRSNRIIIMGENVPPKLVFWHSFSRYGVFLRKKFQSRIPYSILHWEAYIHFCHPTPHSLKNDHASQKLFFAIILENIACFLKKLLYEKYSNSHFLQTSLYWFSLPDTIFPSKWACPLTNGFSQVFQLKLKNTSVVFLLKSILIRKQILWRINFVLLNFLQMHYFLRNYRTNAKILHFSIRLHALGRPCRRSCQVLHSFHYTVGGFGSCQLIFSFMKWY